VAQPKKEKEISRVTRARADISAGKREETSRASRTRRPRVFLQYEILVPEQIFIPHKVGPPKLTPGAEFKPCSVYHYLSAGRGAFMLLTIYLHT
jgi:hypothetical protein